MSRLPEFYASSPSQNHEEDAVDHTKPSETINVQFQVENCGGWE